MPALTIRRVRSATDEDVRPLQSVLEDAPSYSLLVEGRSPSIQAAREVMASLPPRKTYADKFVLLPCDEGVAIGAMNEGLIRVESVSLTLRAADIRRRVGGSTGGLPR